MTTYAIGDPQGCHRELIGLLERLSFDPRRDRLWVAGDLVNRGPDSLACLREIHALGAATQVILGNHDLHLLAVARGGMALKRSDTLDAILEAPDRDVLLDWLQAQPLWIDDECDAADPGSAGSDRSLTIMTHAGLPPFWSTAKARELAAEVEAALRSDTAGSFLEQMYGNLPQRWEERLEGAERLRMIVNSFTRMRFVAEDGTLDFTAKQGLDAAPQGFAPWFAYPRQDDPCILFGHWAALQGKTPGAAVRAEALDTGCVWGGSLTALDLDSGERISEPCHPDT